MFEDDKYRTSTQFRLWSFTESSLRSVRSNTNSLASERVRCAIRRAREARQAQGQPRAASTAPSSSAATPNPGDVGGGEGTPARAGAGGAVAAAGKSGGGEGEIECLTTEEELELVRYYCEKTMELGDEYKPPLPTMVRATAIQYLRRFYLTNSPMTYHPKSIMPCALFLATKTDNYYLSLTSFSEQIPNSSPEDIIAPEFLLTQGLRFTFDVRHPFRGLEGGVMELLAIAEGNAHPGPHRRKYKTASELKRDIQSLQQATPQASAASSGGITTRISKAHHTSRELLKSPAQMTDAYFLYTPSQIWFAALYLADRPLAEFYFDYKIGLPSEDDGSANASNDGAGAGDTDTDTDDPLRPLRSLILQKIKSCAELLSSYTADGSSNNNNTAERMKNLKRIGKKLYHCQNPEKVDIVGLNRAQKRDGGVTGVSGSGSGSASGSGSGSGMPTGGEVFDAEGKGVDIPERAVKKRKVGEESGGGGGGATEVFGGELRG